MVDYKTRELELKQILFGKKEDIKDSFRNRLTYEKWDKKSSVYAYCVLTGDVEKITDIKRIEFLLKLPCHHTVYFSSEKDLNTYKWIKTIIEEEIDNRILESLSSGMESYVDVKDISVGDINEFSIESYLKEQRRLWY